MRAVATSAKKECARLKSELQTQEVEMEKLKKQVCNTGYTQTPTQTQQQNTFSSSSNMASGSHNHTALRPISVTAQSRPDSAQSDIYDTADSQLANDLHHLSKLAISDKYKELNARLKKMLNEERKALQMVSQFVL